MSDWGFVGDAYTAPSIYQDGQELINFFLEEDSSKPQGERGAIALYPTPGFNLAALLPTSPVRSLKVITGGQMMFAVGGNTLYKIDTAYTVTSVGTLLTTSGSVTIDDNGVSIYIVDGVSRYAYTWGTNTFVTLSSATALGVTGVTMTNNGSGYVPIPSNLSWGTQGGGGTVMYPWNVAYGNGKYVVVGFTGSYTVPVAIAYCYSSPDGITWTQRTMTSDFWFTVTWNPNYSVFVAVGVSGSATSPDGVTWTFHATAVGGAGSTQGAGAVWFNNLVVWTNYGGIQTSPDGVTWTLRTNPDATLSWAHCAASSTALVAPALNSGTSYIYSTNGTTFTKYTNLPYAQSWGAIAWNGSLFVILGEGTANYATSSDGLTWTGRTFPVSLSMLGGTSIGNNMTVVNGVFIVLNPTTMNTYSSPDGINWFLNAIPGTNNTFLTLGNNGSSAVAISYATFSSNSGSVSSTGGTYALTFTGGTGSGAAGTYTVNNTGAVVSNPVITSAGSYTVLPTGVAFNYGGGVGAAGTVIGTNSEGAFVGGIRVQTVDNYFVYARPNSTQWAATDPLSTHTSPLSFASKFGSPDNIVSLVVNNREVFLLGEETSEVWIDVGSFPFPFQIIPGSNTNFGCAARDSVAQFVNSFAMVSANERGQGIVVMNQGYGFQRISTHAVENSLVGKVISDAFAFTYQVEGHEIYVCSFPSADVTWCYDISTQKWHKWLSWDGQVFHRHIASCYATFQGNGMIGDYQTGKIYALSNTVYTENGNTIRRLRRAPHLVKDFKRLYFKYLQIQFQPGVGLQTGQGSAPKAMLRWSDDGGSTWSNERWASIGLVGQYKNRAMWRMLGSARDRIFEVSITDPIKAVIVSANLEAEEGSN